MKLNKIIVLSIFLISLLALIVASQVPQRAISIEEKQDCTTTYYNQTENVYGYVTRTRDTYGTCFNAQNSSYYWCVNGTESYQSHEIIDNPVVLINITDCRTSSFVVSIIKGDVTEKKEIDFSNWGACIYGMEDNCMIVTCVSHDDGTFKGQFTDCKGGKSCQKFQICDNQIKVFYKNSREDFVEEDPTFYISKLAYREVGQ